MPGYLNDTGTKVKYVFCSQLQRNPNATMPGEPLWLLCGFYGSGMLVCLFITPQSFPASLL